MLRYLFARRTDWTIFVLACTVSLSLMLLGPGAQARAVWFLQHTLLAPATFAIDWIDRGVSVYWENQALRERVTRLQIEVDRARGEQIENARLRRLLRMAERHPYELVGARVTGRSLDRLGGSLTVDKGGAAGLQAHTPILTPDGLVGRVERSTRHAARVLTLLHRDCAVAARIERSRVDGVVRWEFGDRPTLALLYVSSQQDVAPGDLVVTSGLGGIFPPGIRIGTVASVTLDPNGLMKEISVRPAVNFRGLEEVLAYRAARPGAAVPQDFYAAEDTTASVRPPRPSGSATAAGPSRAASQDRSPSARARALPAAPESGAPAPTEADAPVAGVDAREEAAPADSSGTSSR